MAAPQEHRLAKKVFFVYPHSVVEEQMIEIMIQSEFEAAIVHDHQRVLSLINKFPSSIVFINIEHKALNEQEWEQFILSIMNSKKRHNATVGILVYNQNPEQAQKYLMDLGVEAGYVTLKLGFTESAKIIIKTLIANEARGGRRYIRIKCPPGKGKASIRLGGRDILGQVIDTSSAGFAAIFDNKFPLKTEFEDIQLMLWGAIINVNGIIMGHREQEDGSFVHVIMFSKVLESATKKKLYKFIQKALQSEVNNA
jgi:hypothetical protein